MEPISKIVSMSNKTHNCNNFENGSILMLHYSIDINIKLIK